MTPASNLMPEVDMVLFDSVSAGLGEAIQIGVPAIVYNNHFDYDLASNEGKKINDDLQKSNMLFYDDRSGIGSVEKIINNLPDFHNNAKETINKFRELTAFPVSKEDFTKKLNMFFSEK